MPGYGNGRNSTASTTEHRGRRADAERQCDDDDTGKRRGATKVADGGSERRSHSHFDASLTRLAGFRVEDEQVPVGIHEESPPNADQSSTTPRLRACDHESRHEMLATTDRTSLSLRYVNKSARISLRNEQQCSGCA